jgi:hypothetical protein
MNRAALIGAALALLAAACYGPDPDVSPAGRGLPELAVDFPARSEAGSTQTAVLTVTNPGPEAMGQVVVAFLRVGPGGGSTELPTPIVDGAARHRNPAIVSIDPEPNAISLPAVEFTFGGLAEGESMEIRFRLQIPETRGQAANSVTVYEGSDPQRARGIRLQTEVE